MSLSSGVYPLAQLGHGQPEHLSQFRDVQQAQIAGAPFDISHASAVQTSLHGQVLLYRPPVNSVPADPPAEDRQQFSWSPISLVKNASLRFNNLQLRT